MIQPIRRFIRLEHIRHFLTLFSSSVLGQGLALALAPVLSRLFTPGDFGLSALYLSILSVLSVFSTAKYEQAIMLPKNNEAAIHIFRLVIALAALVSLISLLPIIFLNAGISRLLGNPDIAAWLYILPLSLMVHGLLQASTFYANRSKAFPQMARTTLIHQVSANGIKAGTGWLQTSFNGLITGQVAGQLLAMTYIFRHAIRQISKQRIRFSVKSIRQQASVYIQYPRFNMLMSLTNNLSGSLPIFLFTWGFSPEAAGLYAFGYTFVFRPLGLFSQSTQQVLSQKMIDNYHKGVAIYPTLKKMTFRFALAGLLPLLIMAIWAPGIFSFVFSETYEASGRYLQILSPWLYMVFLASPLTFLHELFFRQKTAMIIDLVYLILRFFALMAGIWMQDLIMALILFSGVGTLVIGYKLWWFLMLAKRASGLKEQSTEIS